MSCRAGCGLSSFIAVIAAMIFFPASPPVTRRDRANGICHIGKQWMAQSPGPRFCLRRRRSAPSAAVAPVRHAAMIDSLEQRLLLTAAPSQTTPDYGVFTPPIFIHGPVTVR